MTVRFLNKVDLGSGVGAYEFALEDHQGAGSQIYEAGSKIYESLLESAHPAVVQSSKNKE